MSDTPAVTVEFVDAAAVVTLRRPETANALSRAIVAGLLDALQTIRNTPEVRAVILTGEGNRAFCAGADLKERAGMSEGEARAFVAGLQGLMNAFEELPIPVIAAINGAALGGGLEMALACDIRIAATTAVLGLPEVRLAIIPGAGGTQRLPRIIGVARARELILTGRRLNGAQAEAIGLVTGVHPPEALLAEAHRLAAEIALGGPIAIRQAKLALRYGPEVDLAAGLALERAAYEAVLQTEDRREALAAFADKRTPIFHGR